MEEQHIIRTITDIFNGADRHDWDEVRDAFTDEVFLDYSSLNGQPGTTLSPADIITAWSHFLPRFRFTLHLLSNFEIDVSGHAAAAFCKGQALHHLPGASGGDLWTVYGTYNFELQQLDGQWKVSIIHFNLLYQEGNKELPAIATRDASPVA